MKVHFIGIGGVGMSVIAELMLAQGHQVSGCDHTDPPVLSWLVQLGAQVQAGHDTAHVQDADLVVTSTAIPADHPEILQARSQGIEVAHRSVALARVARDHELVAVAGAHGKTTTSAMLALALADAGNDPSYAIGAQLRHRGGGGHLGQGSIFVAEADESDGSFLAYTPQVAIVTNIEPDHLDYYGSLEALQEAFVQFAARIRPGGLLIACSDDPGAAELLQRARSDGVRTLAYGTGLGETAPDVHIEFLRLDRGSCDVLLRSDTVLDAEDVQIHVGVPGEHNARNAVAAWCAGHELGVPAPDMAMGLAAFGGTARRFEDRGTVAGVRVIDDYAHHPTEIAALLQTARRAADGGAVRVLFQPHLFSRTEQFAEAFATSLSAADEVVLTAIFAGREAPRADVTSVLIADRIPGAQYRSDGLEAAGLVADAAQPGDLIMTVGAGDVTALAPVILERLRRREPGV